MTPENFINQNFDHCPEERRPEQVTLRHLMNQISNKSKNGDECAEGELCETLRFPGETKGAATIYRTEKGTRPSNPNQVGHITLRESVGDAGDRVHINYFILDVPDGFQMEKHRTVSNKNMFLDSNSTREDVVNVALAGIERLGKKEEVIEVENELGLGLSFVSEQEARDLLCLLDQLEP